MKKILLSSIAGIFLSVAMISAVNGQLASNRAKSPGRFVVLNKTAPQNSPNLVGRVDPSVVRSFVKAYREVSDEKWIEIKGGFVAMFNYNSMDYQVTYNKKGALIRTIRAYNEDQMPQELRHIVKSSYYDYDINRVHEIETPRNPILYVVQLTGKNKIINLAICDGEMEVLQKFNKSK